MAKRHAMGMAYDYLIGGNAYIPDFQVAHTSAKALYRFPPFRSP